MDICDGVYGVFVFMVDVVDIVFGLFKLKLLCVNFDGMCVKYMFDVLVFGMVSGCVIDLMFVVNGGVVENCDGMCWDGIVMCFVNCGMLVFVL